MHFGTLAFGVLRKFVDIGGLKRGISQSHYESTRHFLPCDENRTTPLGEFEKCKFAIIPT